MPHPQLIFRTKATFVCLTTVIILLVYQSVTWDYGAVIRLPDRFQFRQSGNCQNFPLDDGRPDVPDPAIEHTWLIEQIRKRHLTPPSNLPYNLLNPSGRIVNWMRPFHDKIVEILKKQNITNNGFFIECGALDGETFSHSLDLELNSSWSGLLIEASPSKIPQIKGKHRKAWLADVCVSTEPYKKVRFMTKKDQQIQWKQGNGKIKPARLEDAPMNFEGFQEYFDEGMVDCYALYLVLKAVGVESVDLLVLDVEGEEYNVLKSYPFHLLPIKVIAVEHWLTKERGEIVRLLLSKGYELEYVSESDFVFVLKG